MNGLLELPGPQFLGYYIPLVLASAVGVVLLKWLFGGSSPEETEGTHDLDAFHLAYLAGGPSRAVEAVVAGLLHKKCIRHSERSTGGLAPLAPPDPGVHWFEREAFRKLSRHHELTIEDLERELAESLLTLRRPLVGASLLRSEGERWTLSFLSILIVLLPMLLGISKLLRGLSGGHPIGFLTVLLMLQGSVLLFLFRSNLRTRKGEGTLQRMTMNHSGLRTTASSNARSLSESDAPLAAGLFGVAALNAPEYAPIVQQRRKNDNAGACGGDPGAGSSGGDGGGGGADGGGGGGCGGCGGCGS